MEGTLENGTTKAQCYPEECVACLDEGDAAQGEGLLSFSIREAGIMLLPDISAPSSLLFVSHLACKDGNISMNCFIKFSFFFKVYIYQFFENFLQF